MIKCRNIVPALLLFAVWGCEPTDAKKELEKRAADSYYFYPSNLQIAQLAGSEALAGLTQNIREVAFFKLDSTYASSAAMDELRSETLPDTYESFMEVYGGKQDLYIKMSGERVTDDGQIHLVAYLILNGQPMAAYLDGKISLEQVPGMVGELREIEVPNIMPKKFKDEFERELEKEGW